MVTIYKQEGVLNVQLALIVKVVLLVIQVCVQRVLEVIIWYLVALQIILLIHVQLVRVNVSLVLMNHPVLHAKQVIS